MGQIFSLFVVGSLVSLGAGLVSWYVERKRMLSVPEVTDIPQEKETTCSGEEKATFVQEVLDEIVESFTTSKVETSSNESTKWENIFKIVQKRYDQKGDLGNDSKRVGEIGDHPRKEDDTEATTKEDIEATHTENEEDSENKVGDT